MGLTRKSRKIYSRPKQKWDKARIAEEATIVKKFGLKNKRELYVAYRTLKKIRNTAKRLIAQKNPEEEKRFLDKIMERGYLPKTGTLGDVLDITIENILSRRLQTIVFKHKLAKTIKQARQLVVHRKIKVKNAVINIPSYSVSVEEEKQITVNVNSKKNKEIKKQPLEKPSKEVEANA